MKKIFYFLVIFMSLNLCKAQDWAPVGAKWYYDGFGGIGYPDSNNNIVWTYDYHLFESVGDTIINSQLSRIISYNWYHSGGTIIKYPNEYMYSDNGKVYFYRYGKFNLLYDFTAQAGDTISVTDPEFSIDNPDTISRIVIDSVKYMVDVLQPGMLDSVSYGLDSLKVFYSHGVFIQDSIQTLEAGLRFKGPIIENIGCTEWIFPVGMYGFGQPEDIGPLRCYSDSSKIFKWFLGQCDFWIDNSTGINSTIIHLNNEISIFPNPTTGKFTLSTSEKIETIEIYNLLGDKIFYSATIQFEIDLSNQPSGIYFLVAHSKDKTITKKIVKQ